MSQFTFTKAVKQQEKLRMALDGPAGSGKTWTALIIGTDIAHRENGRVAVIDSERSSARKYASDFDFDHLTLPDWSPHTYMGAVRAAVDAGYAVIIIDSFSHAWEGILELKDNATARSKSKNSYTEGWREATPVHNTLVDTVLRADAHVIATLRTKTEYVIEDGRPQKVGMKPIQRDGVDFEFDVVGDMTTENSMVISKTRCPTLAGQVIRKPDIRLAAILWDWLNDGEPRAVQAVIDGLVDRLNALPVDARRAAKNEFVTSFGRPELLTESQVADAEVLVARHEAFAPAEDPDPASSPLTQMLADSDGEIAAHREALIAAAANGRGVGGAADREAADITPAPLSDGADKANVDTPPTTAHGRTRTPEQIGRRSTTVFYDAYDRAPKGHKSRAVDRLRHALVYTVTGGRTTTSTDLDAGELSQVWARMDDIQTGRISYVADTVDDAAGVTWRSGSGRETTVMWTDIEPAAAAVPAGDGAT